MRKILLAAAVTAALGVGAPAALASGPPSSPPGNSGSATDPGQGDHACPHLQSAPPQDSAGVQLAEAILCGGR